jgi:hypothetical protein
VLWGVCGPASAEVGKISVIIADGGAADRRFALITGLKTSLKTALTQLAD